MALFSLPRRSDYAALDRELKWRLTDYLIHPIDGTTFIAEAFRLRCFRQGIEMTSDRLVDTSDRWR